MANITGVGTSNPHAASAPAATKQVAQATQEEVRAGVASKGDTGADRAKLSSSSDLITQALQLPDAPNAKIASLQRSIADGTYSVPAHDVADKLVESLLN